MVAVALALLYQRSRQRTLAAVDRQLAASSSKRNGGREDLRRGAVQKGERGRWEVA